LNSYIAQKLVAIIPVMLLVSAGVFLLLHLIPGDPVAAMLGDNATPESAAALRHELGLDLPLPQQYVRWLGHVLTGDLGRSLRSGQPIAAALGNAVPSHLLDPNLFDFKKLSAGSGNVEAELDLALDTVTANRH